MLSDPIADMLTRIRNGGQARKNRVTMRSTKLKREVARVLQETGFIVAYHSDDDPVKPTLTVEIRYNRHDQPMIEGLERVSKPSRRIYVDSTGIPRVRNGLGVAIISTPRGLLTDDQAREAKVGGEYMARVW